jgi:hypothetical protein
LLSSIKNSFHLKRYDLLGRDRKVDFEESGADRNAKTRVGQEDDRGRGPRECQQSGKCFYKISLKKLKTGIRGTRHKHIRRSLNYNLRL